MGRLTCHVLVTTAQRQRAETVGGISDEVRDQLLVDTKELLQTAGRPAQCHLYLYAEQLCCTTEGWSARCSGSSSGKNAEDAHLTQYPEGQTKPQLLLQQNTRMHGTHQ